MSDQLVSLRLVHASGTQECLGLMDSSSEADGWCGGVVRLLPMGRDLRLVHVELRLEPAGPWVQCAHFSPVHVFAAENTRLSLRIAPCEPEQLRLVR